MKKIFPSKWTALFFLLSLMSLSTAFFSNEKDQGINWTFPYFSGAANFEKLFEWKISPSDFEHASSLSSDAYHQHKHQRTDNLIENTVNSYGYVLVALTSQTLFPFLGDLDGVIVLQLLVHLAASVLLLLILETPLQRYGFILLYAANPLIIYFTTFPFYYFWMFLPSFAFVILILKPKWRNWFVFLAVPILFLSLLIRPTTLFLSLLFFVIAFFIAHSSAERWRSIIAASLLIIGIGLINFNLPTSPPWHTIYVGIGAYENDFGIPDLSDNRGYEYFYRKTGTIIDTDAIHGNWNNPAVRTNYMQTLKERYIQIMHESPLPLIRNAIVNTLQVFSVGYIVSHPLLTWASSVFGMMVLVFLIFTRQYIWILAILASAVSFTWYFPPIPAYNFAAYLLLAIASILGIESFSRKSIKS